MSVDYITTVHLSLFLSSGSRRAEVYAVGLLPFYKKIELIVLTHTTVGRWKVGAAVAIQRKDRVRSRCRRVHGIVSLRFLEFIRSRIYHFDVEYRVYCCWQFIIEPTAAHRLSKGSSAQRIRTPDKELSHVGRFYCSSSLGSGSTFDPALFLDLVRLLVYSACEDRFWTASEFEHPSMVRVRDGDRDRVRVRDRGVVPACRDWTKRS